MRASPLIILAAAALLVLPAAARADEVPRRDKRVYLFDYQSGEILPLRGRRIYNDGDMVFDAVDRDGNGELSRREIQRYLRQFEKDHARTYGRAGAELAALRLQLRYEAADANGNNRVTRAEFDAYRAQTPARDYRLTDRSERVFYYGD